MNDSEAFAVVREAARRKLGMRHFDVQVSLYHSLAYQDLDNLIVCYSFAYFYYFITISIVRVDSL